jgi:MSHA biogenesis protein MshP
MTMHPFTFSPVRARGHLPRRQAQGGLGVVAAIVVLVMLSTLAAGVVRLTFTQQVTSAMDIQGARALQTANAGVEWGMYQALKGSWAGCSGSSQTLDLRSTMGFMVTVSCTSRSPAFVEGASTSGARSVRLYIIDAIACSSSSACPDATRSATSNYIERRRQAMVTDISTEE